MPQCICLMDADLHQPQPRFPVYKGKRYAYRDLGVMDQYPREYEIYNQYGTSCIIISAAVFEAIFQEIQVYREAQINLIIE